MKHPQYNPALPNEPLSDAEVDQLDSLLAKVDSDAVLDVESLDGYLTGLLVSPQLPASDVWLSRIWGGDEDSEPPFPSGKQTKKVVQLALRMMAGTDRQLRGDMSRFEPWFGVAESGPEEWVDAQVWCAGFLLALDLCADQWQHDWDLPEVALALRPIVLLGGDELAPEDSALVATPAQRDEWSRQVPDSIEALLRHWHPTRLDPAVAADPSDDAADA
ncbi:YecA family protein [Sphaerotilus mobilis]|uniref:YecA family protein n=1 Tax=Sphaerotilus mobilis TaxID=47994 RepID=A0A4Q7LLH6_9BURK|nr:YecA family protein [Sphaerotilus mobilis]RZS54757.1 uncharacterized protein EV685_2241 [Sphaerotilus mobilis]